MKFLFRMIVVIQLGFIACLPCVASTTKQVVKPVVKIAYGSNRYILYDLKGGTYNVYSGGHLAYSNVAFSAKINGKTVSSRDYTSRRYNEKAIKDGFGKGEKHIVTLTGNDLTKIEQVFYTYPGKDYFLTQIIAIGKGLKSNSIVPFSGNITAISGDPRSVFVPFDNDTFISYDAKPFVAPFTNSSAEVGVVYDNNSRGGYVAGSVEHEVWKTGVISTAKTDSGNAVKIWSGYTEKSVTRDAIAHGEIVGDMISSPKIFIGYFSDWRTGMEQYAKANRIAEPPYVFSWTKPTPVGWNSWGVLKDHLTYENATKVADFFADSIPAFRTGNKAFIDMDSFWDFMLKGGLEGDYSKLKAFADYCKSKGLQPGVYWAPFTDWGWQGGPGRKVQGSNYTFGDIWTKVGDGYHEIDGARALDPTHPGTKQRIDLVIGKLKECGFKMIKIDFLGHASVESTHFYDPKVTTGMQAYREGMEYLVDKLDGQMLIYAAISPSMATGRYVHTRRIACDAFKSINDTQYTLNSLTYGWWQTYLYNYVDADHVVLSDEKDGANRARILSAMITGTFITGDDFSTHGQWSAKAKAIYQNPEILSVIKNGRAFKPVEGNTGQKATELFTQKIGEDYYVAVFNYSAQAKTITVDYKRWGLPASGNYKVEELLKGDSKLIGSINIGAADAALYKFSGRK